MYCGMSMVLSSRLDADVYLKFVGQSVCLAFVSNRELSANAPTCRKVLPVRLHVLLYDVCIYEYVYNYFCREGITIAWRTIEKET